MHLSPTSKLGYLSFNVERKRYTGRLNYPFTNFLLTDKPFPDPGDTKMSFYSNATVVPCSEEPGRKCTLESGWRTHDLLLVNP